MLGHLGFGMDWGWHDLQQRSWLRSRLWLQRRAGSTFRWIPAGGIFSLAAMPSLPRERRRVGGSGCTTAHSRSPVMASGRRDRRPLKASEDQIEVNQIRRPLSDAHVEQQSAIGDGIRPNCEAYGHLPTPMAGVPTSTPTTANSKEPKR